MRAKTLLLILFSLACFFSCLSVAQQAPYARFNGVQKKSGKYVPDKSSPEFTKDGPPDNFLISWLQQILETDAPEELKKTFPNGTIPSHLKDVNQLAEFINAPVNESGDARIPPILPQMGPVIPSHIEARMLLSHLPFALDPKCINDRSKWYFRTIDGSCNWMEVNKIDYGQLGTVKARDYNQHSFKDGISQPRDGPNPRAVSNAFFKRKQQLYYEHTPLLLGLIEFIMHDVTYSEDSTEEFIDVPMPQDEETYPLNTTLRVWRSLPVPGTGTSQDNPRELLNQATTWLDVSSLYGSTREVSNALRAFRGGKLLSQKGGVQDPTREYLPQNTMGLPMRTRQGVDAATLFAGGDPRTNEDWIMLSVHTLMLREHNRLCDILAKKHPEYDDERLYQTVRLILSAKFALIANSYQMTYWTKDMPWPIDDGFPLYRQLYGENSLEINPAHSYPWPLVTKGGKPMVASAEMAIVYRFHEFIIKDFPIKDALNNTLRTQNLFSTAFDSKGFIDTGVEGILRGMLATHIPNFKSGVEEEFRSAGQYRGKPFDIATWSIVHEREQGLPTFNQYFKAYNAQDPAVVVPIRKTFEDFSSDPEAVANLKRLYNSPDEVDLVVGVQLEEEMFPGTTVPKSSLIISLFSLFGLGNSDRFSVGYAMMRCLLVDKPWDCRPSNALEELLWAPKPTETHPNARFYDTFWLAELDFQAHGKNLLWRLVTENTDIKCLQGNALLPFDPVTNPILCALPAQKLNIPTTIYTGVEVVLALIKIHKRTILKVLGTLAVIAFFAIRKKHQKFPPVMYGLPVVGEGLKFQKDPKSLLLSGFKKYSDSASSAFGIKLGSLTHFVITQPKDMEALTKDADYDYHFSLHEFFRVMGFDLITTKTYFESDTHAKLIRKYLGDEKVLGGFALTAASASESFLRVHPPVPLDQSSKHYDSIDDYLTHYLAYVISRCIVGEDGFDDEKLLETFIKFDGDAVTAVGIASNLPKFLKGLAGIRINRNFKTIRKVLIPIIEKRRSGTEKQSRSDLPDFLDFIIPVVEDNSDASDLVALVVWIGFTNLRSTFSSTFLDITNHPGLQDTLITSLAGANTQNIQVQSTPNSSSEWNLLRSAMFESIRLVGPITSCARIIMKGIALPSQPTLQLPEKQVVTLSAFHVHRQSTVWGPSAADYQFDRFAKQDPPIGSTKYITWGLKGPHMCPGRFFAQMTIQIMTKTILERYVFEQDLTVAEANKLVYTGGIVKWRDVAITARRRDS